MKPWLGITWGISNRFGWGVYGLNLAMECLRRGAPTPVCFDAITTQFLPADTVKTLQPVIDFQEQNIKQMFRQSQVAVLKDATVLHALGNGMEWSLLSQSFQGDINIGVIFFEFTEITPEGRARLSRLNGVIAGSTWNADVLEKWGVANVHTVLQGVDTDRFRPKAPTGKYKDKFAVFSGGKLDYRKGQDIVLMAFKEFSKRHDDAVLVTAWQNLWPLTAIGFGHSPYGPLPKVAADDSLMIADWAARHGVPSEKFVDLGMVPNEEMPDILRDMDLAVFPNRCEGGTNLVAMETMACGVPVILSDNTGHKDLIADDRCYVLETQDPVSFTGVSVDGWGESSVEELVQHMETVYAERDAAKRRAQRAAEFMEGLSWRNQIDLLLSTIEELEQVKPEAPANE